LSTAGVLSGHGPSSKVSSTSLMRRKSCILKCSNTKPGPPLVSISTVRARPSAFGLPGQAGAEGRAAGGVAATASAAVGAGVATVAGAAVGVAAVAGAAAGTGATAGAGARLCANATHKTPKSKLANRSVDTTAARIVPSRKSRSPQWNFDAGGPLAGMAAGRSRSYAARRRLGLRS
jgi:hypothetical protein